MSKDNIRRGLPGRIKRTRARPTLPPDPREDPLVKASFEIWDQARQGKAYTNAAVNRLVKALRILGLEGENLTYVLACFEVCEQYTGDSLYPRIKRIW